MKKRSSTTANLKEGENRRSFLKKIGKSTTAGLSVAAFGVTGAAANSSQDVVAQKSSFSPSDRATDAFQLRMDAATRQHNRPPVTHPVNGDEAKYSDFLGNFSKTLPHNGLGEVDPIAYNALLAAVTSGDQADYDVIPLGGPVKLANPMAANSFILEGCDGHSLTMPAPPALASYTEAGEILEVYWQAVLRDLPFDEYQNNSLISTAAAELRRFPQFRFVSPVGLFRGDTKGDNVGPYISQFLLQPIPFGATTINQKYRVPFLGDDHMTDYSDWLDIQDGALPEAPNNLDPTKRYLRNGRDLCEYVHQDTPSQAYYGAAQIMLGWGNAALSATNPYHSIVNQDSFVQFGAPHVIDMVTRAAVAALKCAWFQKWNIHRRLRPEAFGGIIHNQLTSATSYPIRMYLSGSKALQSVYSQYGSYLLPMAYPEGSPTHPAYPAGHATVAGACATILKAFFNEDFAIPSPVVAGVDGQSLDPYSEETLTIGNEINKLASNITLGRDFAGVHWRSDGTEGLRLGEQVAIQLLSDYSETYSEGFGGFTLSKFSGERITI